MVLRAGISLRRSTPLQTLTIALAVTTQSSETMRDILLAQTTESCIAGHLSLASAAGLSSAYLLPHLAKPVLARARGSWQSHVEGLARKKMLVAQEEKSASLAEIPEQLGAKLRAAASQGVDLTTEAAEGLCGLVAQACVLGASPLGMGIGGALLALAAAAVVVGWDAAEIQAALQSRALAQCEDVCEQLWEEHSASARQSCITACAVQAAQVAKKVRGDETLHRWTAFAGHALGILPAVASVQSIALSRSGVDPTSLPAAINVLEESHTLLHLAVWLPIAAQHLIGMRRVLAKFHERMMAA